MAKEGRIFKNTQRKSNKTINRRAVFAPEVGDKGHISKWERNKYLKMCCTCTASDCIMEVKRTGRK